MGLIVSKAGILDTIQDLGRHGFRKYGINSTGAMDPTALRLLNTLLGNEENEAAIECHFPAGEFIFDQECVFALGGADFSAELDGKPMDSWKPIFPRNRSVLRFLRPRLGQRAYLAVSGGISIGKWLNSAGTDLNAVRGGIEGRKLKSGDVIEFQAGSALQLPSVRIASSLISRYSRFPTVRVIKGPEFDLLDGESRQKLVSSNFQISTESNRMGYQLIGDALNLEAPREYISSGVTFGTVQLLSDGQLIVLMADHQTTGGYPRIANIIEADLSLMAQLGPGDKAAFHLLSIEEAERTYAEFERDLRRLKIGASLLK